MVRWLVAWPWTDSRRCPCQTNPHDDPSSLKSQYRKHAVTTQVTEVDLTSLTIVEQYLFGVLFFRPRTTLVLENFSHQAWVTDLMTRVLKQIACADVWSDDNGLPVAMNLHPEALSQNMREQFARFSHWPPFMHELSLTVDSPHDPGYPFSRYYLPPTPDPLDKRSFDHDLATVCRFLELTMLPGTLGCGRIAFPTGWILDDTMPQPALLSLLSLHYDTIFLYVGETDRKVRWIVLCNHSDPGH